MSELIRYAAALEEQAERGLPPVDLWDPPLTGDIDMQIRRDGVWVHEGAPIARARLARLFSTILKREGDEFFLVTPVEKFRLSVEDAPFVAISMRVENSGGDHQELVFTTNFAEEIVAGPDHPIRFSEDAETGAPIPYIEVRAGLEARAMRAVYYDLVALCETRNMNGEELLGVQSGGVFFAIGRPELLAQ